ncbi:hypothetical protein [Sediminibacterium salmoneum]|uniref:hypothetical protein n=1 Tax=Sediminibacterium salmoneum TaxID=426421 RepID=UPI00047DFAE2|nr:hypothetical protein [Sediminibacterium salmoneum]
MEEKSVEIYYDHYKDTFENIKTYIQRRNYYTITILCLLMFLSFQISNPEKTVEISNEIVKKNVGDVLINFKYITHILLFALLWVVIMYFQILFVIEKHYSYIHEIEARLTDKLKPFEILREGKNYLDHYPWLSSVVDRIYTIIFPLALVLISVAKWFVEKNNLNRLYKNWNFWIDTILLFGIIIISLLYLSYKHFNDFKKKDQQELVINYSTEYV